MSPQRRPLILPRRHGDVRQTFHMRPALQHFSAQAMLRSSGKGKARRGPMPRFHDRTSPATSATVNAPQKLVSARGHQYRPSGIVRSDPPLDPESASSGRRQIALVGFRRFRTKLGTAEHFVAKAGREPLNPHAIKPAVNTCSRHAGFPDHFLSARRTPAVIQTWLKRAGMINLDRLVIFTGIVKYLC